MSSQNIYYKIDCPSLRPDPIRLDLEAPQAIASDAPNGFLDPAPAAQLFTIATGRWGANMINLKNMAERADETILSALLSSDLSTNTGFTSDVLAALHTIIKRSLETAKRRGEIWSPILNALSHGRPDTYRYSYGRPANKSYWSDQSVEDIKAAHPGLELLPSPSTWLLGAADWVASTPANHILTKIATQDIDPWHPVLSEYAYPITPELVDLLLPNQQSILTLISRDLSEDEYTLILRRTLRRLSGKESAKAPLLENSLLPYPDAVPAPARPHYAHLAKQSADILRAEASTNNLLDDEREIFARVTGKLGRIPEVIRAELDASARDADKTVGRPIISGAQIIRATDQTVPGTEFVPLLDPTSKGATPSYPPPQALAPLAGHADFISRAKQPYYDALLRKTQNSWYTPTLFGLLMKERTIDPRVMLDLAAESLKPNSSGNRDSQQIIEVINHPSTTIEVLRLIAEKGDMTPVKIALAEHRVARHDKEIRPMLLRMRIPEVTAPLLKDTAPEDFLDLWHKLVRAAPEKALDMLERGETPKGVNIPRLTIAPILKSGNKELILRTMRLSKLLSNDDMTAAQTARAKKTLLAKKRA